MGHMTIWHGESKVSTFMSRLPPTPWSCGWVEGASRSVAVCASRLGPLHSVITAIREQTEHLLASTFLCVAPVHHELAASSGSEDRAVIPALVRGLYRR